MEDTSGNKDKQICLGLVAHVDSGKTTLAESILYQSGQIRTLGRVDHKDAFLDTYELEKDRGITIFSKQAQTVIGDRQVTLLDTAGRTASRDRCAPSGPCWTGMRFRFFFL